LRDWSVPTGTPEVLLDKSKEPHTDLNLISVYSVIGSFLLLTANFVPEESSLLQFEMLCSQLQELYAGSYMLVF
jgi:hypothetical protein